MPLEINFVASVGASRIRIPKALVTDLQWGSETPSIQAIGILTYPGELLCTAISAIDKDDAHPFREAMELRMLAPLTEGWTSRAAPGKQFALAFRLFEFEAKWVSAAKLQLDLQVGAAITKLSGWPGATNNPPLYAACRDSVLALFSTERLMDLLREQPMAP